MSYLRKETVEQVLTLHDFISKLEDKFEKPTAL